MKSLGERFTEVTIRLNSVFKLSHHEKHAGIVAGMLSTNKRNAVIRVVVVTALQKYPAPRLCDLNAEDKRTVDAQLCLLEATYKANDDRGYRQHGANNALFNKWIAEYETLVFKARDGLARDEVRG
jgi:hypothetical protein